MLQKNGKVKKNKKDYNKKKKRVEFKSDLFEYIRGQGESISKGESGSYIDRMVVNIAKSDLFRLLP